MKSYIPLETAAIFFLANLFPKQGISSDYVKADFIFMGFIELQGAKTENNKMKNQGVFVKHYSMPPVATKSKKLFLASTSKSRSQGH